MRLSGIARGPVEGATLLERTVVTAESGPLGKIEKLAGGQATITGEGWSLDGVVRGPKPLTQSADAQAVIRVEQITVADAPGPGRIEMQLDDSLYLGDRW